MQRRPKIPGTVPGPGMFHIIHGNRLEALADRLLADPARRDLPVLSPETVIVPSLGMARWLKDRIADRDGIAAHLECAYLGEFIWKAFSERLPEVPARSPFDPASTAWWLFERLAALPACSDYAPLAAYIARSDPRGRMGLASRIAGLFDQYLVYRPDWLRSWHEGRCLGLGPDDQELWQARLWRELAALSPMAEHPKDRFLAALAERPEAPSRLPARIVLFAIPHLPPLYLEVLVALSAHCEIDYYLLNPCREYWADIVAERDRARLALAAGAPPAHHEIGHPLLAAWGRQPRDHLALITALGGEDGVLHDEHYVEPAGPALLARVQRAIFDLAALDPAGLAAEDRSIEVHVCHSLSRELEVLHDQLLARFDADPGLRPSDIVVMTPDLESAAPHIDAVFGAAPPARLIPFSITGRSDPGNTPLLRVCMTLLALPSSRFEAHAILGLIECPAVARRFGIGEADLGCIRAWLSEAGVCWGLDAAHRARLGLPAEPRHTWSEGLARLILGYALPGQGRREFAGLLPYDDIEGGMALTLGKLTTVVEALADTARDLSLPRPPDEWAQRLIATLDRFLLPAEDEQETLKRIRRALASLAEDAALAGAHTPVSIEVMAERLEDRLASRAPGAAPGGGVTFCAIGGLRGLPFRVVCLIGMGDGAFPRRGAALEFDLMAARPRLGDRARRHDDRADFLDALLAARDAFYLSYTGHGEGDDSVLPPAIPVSELIAYLQRYLPLSTLITEHRLQAWSPHYFRGPGPLYSYAAEFLAQPSRSGPRPLIEGPLPEPGPEWRQRDLAELVDFFAHPVRYLLRERLGIELATAEDEPASEEPFRLGRADEYRLAERLLPLMLAGEDLGKVARAGSELPQGAAGRAELARERRVLSGFAAELTRQRPPEPLPALPFELSVGDLMLTGTLSGLHAGGLFGHRLATQTPYGLWNAWLRHLVLCALRPPGIAAESRLLLKDGLLRFVAVPDPMAALEALARHYREGLGTPLVHAPKSALALVAGSPTKAHAAWAGNPPQHPGENQDPWFRLLYGGVRDEFPEGFESTAHALLDPLYTHLSEGEP